MPLEQCRAQGRWPESFDQFWGSWNSATESRMERALWWTSCCSAVSTASQRVRRAVEQALEVGVSDVAAIRYLLELEQSGETGSQAEVSIVGWLSRYERPQPSLI